MKQFFITVLGVIIGGFIFMFLLIFLLAGLGAALGGKADPKTVTGATVLTLDLRKPMRDHSAGESLFGAQPGSVVDTVRALDRAKTDENIKGLLIRSGFGMAPASAEEIRLAILDFKESGKFVVAHSQGFEATSVIPYMQSRRPMKFGSKRHPGLHQPAFIQKVRFTAVSLINMTQKRSSRNFMNTKARQTLTRNQV